MSGKWKMESGKLKVESVFVLLPERDFYNFTIQGIYNY